MLELPPFLSASPEQEALELALDKLIFEPSAAGDQDGQPLPLRAYALLDASQSADIPVCLQGFPSPATCLFNGAAYDDLAEVAPWLVELHRYSNVWDWLVEDGFGQNWGIFLHSQLPLPKLKTHLKKFVKIDDPDGVAYYFKYYRPEHLNTYLPVLEPAQAARFFQGVEAIWAESRTEAGRLHRHCLKDGSLFTETFDLAQIGKSLLPVSASPEEAAGWIEAAHRAPSP